MTKLMCLGFAMFAMFSVATVTMTPPAASAWAARHEAQANARPASHHMVVLPTIEIVGNVERMCRGTVLPTITIVGRVDQKCVEIVGVETFHSHEEYDVGTTHIVADGTATIYASR